MEEAKAAAYYDELTRKGEGAARFKQGLGFSSSSAASDAGTVPSRGSAFNSPSSFLSSFVRASSPSKAAAAAAEFQKQKQLESIQNKLRKKPDLEEKRSRVSEGRGSSRHRDRSPSRERRSRRRSRSRDRRRDRSSSRERDRDSDRRRRGERRRRSRSRSVSDEERGQRRGRERRRSRSPRSERLSERGGRGDRGGDGGGSKVDYSKMIEGYEKMSAAERVKAKMKLQLSETAKKDTMISMGTGWERFEFDKDAPLDDEEVEAAEDDTMVVKQMGQSFRFSAVEAKKEEQIKAAHDKAMFGAPALPMFTAADGVEEQNNDKKEATESAPVSNLMSEKVLAKQKGSWRDRARKL